MNKGEKFKKMFELDVSLHTEQLDNGTGFKPTYLSWSSAVLLANENYDGFDFRFVYNDDGTPVFYNPIIDGFFVRTEVTIDEWASKTELTLPVLDNKFKPQGKAVRTYNVYDKFNKKHIEKHIQPASSFDINYSQMRCLTKNISVATGIGLKLYFKEGLQSAMHRDQLEKEAQAKQEEMEANKEDTVQEIKDHVLYKNEKAKAYFAKKGIKFTLTELRKQTPDILLGILQKLEKFQEKILEEEAKAGATKPEGAE